jgi:hypothetical protein
MLDYCLSRRDGALIAVYRKLTGITTVWPSAIVGHWLTPEIKRGWPLNFVLGQ